MKTLLWQKPLGLASVGFHLQHIAGIQDRLFTYAKGEVLSEQQLEYLSNEGKENNAITINNLLENLNKQTAISVEELSNTNAHILTEVRNVGRKQIPSTVIGLLVHAAEHTMRHTGQIIGNNKTIKHT